MSEKPLIFATFVFSCVALGLLAGSLGSDYWVVANVHREANEKSEGWVNFGLFKGTRRLNHGFGERVYDLSVLEAQYRQRDFLVRELYVCTVAAACGALLLGVAAAVLALHNVAADPADDACALPGLIVLNLVSFAFAATSALTWVAQFFCTLRHNVLIREDILSGGWSSRGGAWLGFSFYMCLGAALLFLADLVILWSIRRKQNRKRNTKRTAIMAATKPNANLMLY